MTQDFIWSGQEPTSTSSHRDHRESVTFHLLADTTVSRLLRASGTDATPLLPRPGVGPSIDRTRVGTSTNSSRGRDLLPPLLRSLHQTQGRVRSRDTGRNTVSIPSSKDFASLSIIPSTWSGHQRHQFIQFQRLYLLKLFDAEIIQKNLLRSDEVIHTVIMFLIYSSDSSRNLFMIGVIAGRKANSVQRWETSDYPDNDIFTVDGVPIIVFDTSEDARRNHDPGTWHIGSVHLVRTAHTGWVWMPEITKMPRKPRRYTRSYNLGCPLLPTYVCLGFDPEGVPILMAGTAPTIGPYVIRPAQLMKIAEVTTRANPELAASMVRIRRRDSNNNEHPDDVPEHLQSDLHDTTCQGEADNYDPPPEPEAEDQNNDTPEDYSDAKTCLVRAVPRGAREHLDDMALIEEELYDLAFPPLDDQ